MVIWVMTKTNHTMTPSQKKSVDRIVRYFTNNIIDPEKEVVLDPEIDSSYSSFISVTVKTKRTDCEEYSPRSVYCRDGVHVTIKRGGGITVHSSYQFQPDHGTLLHLCYMLGGKLSGERQIPPSERRYKQIQNWNKKNR